MFFRMTVKLPGSGDGKVSKSGSWSPWRPIISKVDRDDVKGESFRGAFRAVLTVKVREFGGNRLLIGWKSPTCGLWPVVERWRWDAEGESFRERQGRHRISREIAIWPKGEILREPLRRQSSTLNPFLFDVTL
jgi:hypothetical protein